MKTIEKTLKDVIKLNMCLFWFVQNMLEFGLGPYITKKEEK